MLNTLRTLFRRGYVPAKIDQLSVATVLLKQQRFLYAKSALGLDGFNQKQDQIKQQIGNLGQGFRDRMAQYAGEDSTTMIFTEDLKNMMHLAENESDLQLAINMTKKFNKQNKNMRFGNFVFGPVMMRMFYAQNRADLAIESFKMAELEGILDQLITYQLLLDLLYENGKYKEMLEIFDIIKTKQIATARFPRNAVVLVMGACYKLNNEEAVEYALNLWKELNEAGHVAMRRAVTFCAGLLLKQKKPEIALEILSTSRPTYFMIRTLKVKALIDVGRLDEALMALKSALSNDSPRPIQQTINREIFECFKEAVQKLEQNSEIPMEFRNLEKIFNNEGHISDLTLDDQLCAEIQPAFSIKNRQPSYFNRNESFENPRRDRTQSFGRRSRPSLMDMA